MKYLLILLFISVNLYCDDYYLLINSKIKSIKIYNLSVSYKNKKTFLGEANSVYFAYYDESGKIIEEGGGKNDKDISWKKKYIYEREEKGIKKYCKDILDIKEIGQEIRDICSNNLKKISEIKIENMADGDMLTLSFILKEKNLNIYYVFDSNYLVEDKIVKKIDDNGRLKEEIKYDKNDEIIYKKVYDRDKFVFSVKTYDKDNILKEVITKEYRTDGIIRKETFMSYTFTQNLSSKREIFYNGYGLKEEEKLYDSNGVFYKNYIFEYDLDSKGNWIKEVQYVRDINSLDKKPESAVKRVIEYL